ncbi:MAG TPA: nucleotidyltransferase family protein [Armatimonadota bacterium]|nr:nucleotidyltransferase family protein [Armatimonadota bacterium]
MQPEDELLLLAARSAMNADERTHFAKLLAAPLDWRYLTAMASAHGIAPLFCHHCRQYALLSLLPAKARSYLECLGYASALRSLRAMAELPPLLSAWDAAGIPAIVLKGVILEQFYGSGLRPMADVDVLVAPENLATAEALLVEQGYILDAPVSRFRQAWERSHMHLRFCHPEAAMPVELHWDLMPQQTRMPFSLNTDAIRARACRTRIAGAPAWTLNGEDLLLYLVLHHFRHGGQSLLGYADVAETVRQLGARLSWEDVVDRAGAWGAEDIASYILAWVQHYLGAPVPPIVIRTLCPSGKTPRLGKNPIPAPGMINNRWACLARQLPFFLNMRWRLGYAWHSLFPSPSEVACMGGNTPREYLSTLLGPARLRRGLRQTLALARRNGSHRGRRVKTHSG